MYPGFKETVKNLWEKPVRASNSATTISAKLKNVRRGLKHWSKSISKLKLLIENSNMVLLQLDVLEEKRPLFLQEWNFRVILKRHINRLLEYQNKYWKKRCTYRWAQVGDENTKYFHARATERFRHNSIVSLTLEDGRRVENHEEKAAAFLTSFKSRMGVSNTPHICFDLAALFQRVEGLEEVSAPFTKEVIDKVIKSIPADKAPGPDGFNGMFLKVCWDIIAPEFYILLQDFAEGIVFMDDINNSLITLIPKKVSPTGVNDYRPISLLNSCLKLLTKLLADRRQEWILKLIHPNQYGFIKGRTIQDCLAWAFEFLHQCETSKREIIILKLDFEKAFDMMEHDTILKILAHMGFDDVWIKWMKCILYSGHSSV
jgi:hypothetical protein